MGSAEGKVQRVHGCLLISFSAERSLLISIFIIIFSMISLIIGPPKANLFVAIVTVASAYTFLYLNSHIHCDCHRYYLVDF